MKTIARTLIVAGVAFASLGTGLASAQADVIEVNATNAAPDTTNDPHQDCIGFDDSKGKRVATVYNPLYPAQEFVVVGGLYVNTVANCIG